MKCHKHLKPLLLLPTTPCNLIVVVSVVGWIIIATIGCNAIAIDGKVGLGAAIAELAVIDAATPVVDLFDHDVGGQLLLKTAVIVLWTPWTFILHSRC